MISLIQNSGGFFKQQVAQHKRQRNAATLKDTDSDLSDLKVFRIFVFEFRVVGELGC